MTHTALLATSMMLSNQPECSCHGAGKARTCALTGAPLPAGLPLAGAGTCRSPAPRRSHARAAALAPPAAWRPPAQHSPGQGHTQRRPRAPSEQPAQPPCAFPAQRRPRASCRQLPSLLQGTAQCACPPASSPAPAAPARRPPPRAAPPARPAGSAWRPWPCPRRTGRAACSARCRPGPWPACRTRVARHASACAESNLVMLIGSSGRPGPHRACFMVQQRAGHAVLHTVKHAQRAPRAVLRRFPHCDTDFAGCAGGCEAARSGRRTSSHTMASRHGTAPADICAETRSVYAAAAAGCKLLITPQCSWLARSLKARKARSLTP
jgi:hypothetical protein